MGLALQLVTSLVALRLKLSLVWVVMAYVPAVLIAMTVVLAALIYPQ
jgi:hypothetical protein